MYEAWRTVTFYQSVARDVDNLRRKLLVLNPGPVLEMSTKSKILRLIKALLLSWLVWKCVYEWGGIWCSGKKPYKCSLFTIAPPAVSVSMWIYAIYCQSTFAWHIITEVMICWNVVNKVGHTQGRARHRSSPSGIPMWVWHDVNVRGYPGGRRTFRVSLFSPLNV